VNVQVPLVKNDLDQSEESLSALSKTLPTVQEQVTNIRNVYDSGRRKVIQANHSISFEILICLYRRRLLCPISNG
jgi:hypothetical protein